MVVGIISDTHGNKDDTLRALELLSDADYIIHLGDVLYNYSYSGDDELADILKSRDDIKYIEGNCDSYNDQNMVGQTFAREEIFELDGHRLYATHGHLHSPVAIKMKAQESGSDIVATGHTHKKHLIKEDGIIYLNPGSVSLPRDDSKSIAKYTQGKLQLIDLETGFITDMIELKKDT